MFFFFFQVSTVNITDHMLLYTCSYGPLDTSLNVIHYSDYKGKTMLYLMEYKTASSTGPQLVKCPQDIYFMDILGDYLLHYRNKIPNSCNSDLVFLEVTEDGNKRVNMHR